MGFWKTITAPFRAVADIVEDVGKTVVKAVKNVGNAVVKTVKAVVKDPLPTLLAVAGQAIGIPAPVTQAAITLGRGGSLEDAAKAGAIAYVAPKISAQIAPAIDKAVGTAVTDEGARQAITAATSQALVAGSLTAATGGDWKQASTGAFAGSMAATGYDKYVAPAVAAQVQKAGLSVGMSRMFQNALRSGSAGGVGTAAQGGDFAAGFANAAVSSGWDDLTTKAAEGLQGIKNNYIKDTNIVSNPPTKNGIPSSLVDKVPTGQFAQTFPAVEEQLAQALSLPKSPSYGQQYGPALAANETRIYLKPDDGDFSKYDFVKNIPASVIVDPDSGDNPYIVTGKKDLTSSEQSALIDELKKDAIIGDASSLKALTTIGQIPKTSEVVTDKTGTGTLSSRDITQFISQANKSSNELNEARVKANANPTPQNIAAVKNAELQADLDKKSLDNARITASQNALTAPVVTKQPEKIVTPLGSVDASIARAFGTPQNLMAAIRSGAVKADPVTPVKTQPVTPVDPTTRPSPFETTVVRPTDGGIKTPTTPSNLPYESIDRLILNASNASVVADDAKIKASINPTPANIVAAQNAQLNFDLAKNALASAGGVPADGGIPTGGAASVGSKTRIPLSNFMPGSVMPAGITGGIKSGITTGTPTGVPTGAPTGIPTGVPTGVPTGALTGVAGVTEPGTGVEPGTDLKPGIEDESGDGTEPGGITTPVVPPITPPPAGTVTPPGGTPKPDGGVKPGGGTGGLPIPSNLINIPGLSGLYFLNNLSSQGMQYIPGTPAEIDTNSLIMMSPDEYARRTELASMFSVARGGLITLKKQR